MEKYWLKSYPPGVARTVDIHRYNSLAHLFDSCAEKYTNLPAFSNMGAALSYSELSVETYNFAAFLQTELSMQKGDRFAIMLPNLLQFPVAMYGAIRAGLVCVAINPLYTARELKHYLVDSGATAIVILENFAHILAEVIHETAIKHIILARVGDLLNFPKSIIANLFLKYIKKKIPPYQLPSTINFKYALARGQQSQFVKPKLNRDDIAFLQFTGGTTGLAKGAVLTHGNLLANIEQITAWFAPVIKEGKEIVITALPLYHIFSLTANCFFFTRMGGFNYLITNPRDIAGFIKEVHKLRFTIITGVNTLFNGLLNTPEFSRVDFSGLKMTLGGGMAIQRSVAEEWKKVTGCTVLEGYGLTETSPVVCVNPYNISAYTGSIGLPVANTEVSIQDDGGKLGEPGELCVRGPQVMREYWNRPDETKKVLTSDGWLRTGDIATMDEQGYVRIVDRKKDMILVSGFNVYPNEIEDVIQSHPGVLEVAAIGVKDAESGEVVKVFVIKKDPSLTEKDVLDHCKTRLTRYKWPKHIEFRDQLPKSNVGKILRQALRQANA